MIAVGMNGQPLPQRHGYPARLIIPGLYGYVSATKWLSELELTGWDEFDGYWIPRGWAKEAPILTQSRIDTPKGGATVSGGTSVPIGGVAWAPDRGISRVEVATTPAEIQRGLQGRQTLPPDGGMLLLAGEPRNMRMWMKDTPVPLDMLFFDADWIIRAITPNAGPHSKRLIPSPGPVAGVLELAGGTAARLGIRPGDRIVYGHRHEDPGAPPGD